MYRSSGNRKGVGSGGWNVNQAVMATGFPSSFFFASACSVFFFSSIFCVSRSFIFFSKASIFCSLVNVRVLFWLDAGPWTVPVCGGVTITVGSVDETPR